MTFAGAKSKTREGLGSLDPRCFRLPNSSVTVVVRESAKEIPMHSKEFFHDFSGSSFIPVAWFEFAGWSPGRDCGVGRGGAGDLRLFDFVRLLVHADNVRLCGGGVNEGCGGAQAPLAAERRVAGLPVFLAGVVLEP